MTVHTWAAPSAIVANWLRSPHSPRNVNTNDCTNTGPKIRLKKFLAPSSHVDFLQAFGKGGALLALPSSKDPIGIVSPSSSAISSSASLVSSFILSSPKSPLMCFASAAILSPKIRNNTAAASWVHDRGKREGNTCPKNAERADISSSEAKAPEKTIKREWRIASSTEIRNVLSPISENKMSRIDCIKVSIDEGPAVAGGGDGEDMIDNSLVIVIWLYIPTVTATSSLPRPRWPKEQCLSSAELANTI